MKTLHQLLNGDTQRSRGHVARRVGYFSSVAVALALLIAGLFVYGRAQKDDDVQVRGDWKNVLPMVAMAYGSLLLLAVAIIEIRVRHVRVGSLSLRAQTLDELVSHLTQCQENEREELGIRLHDDVGALLTALKLETEALERRTDTTPADWRHINQLLDDLLVEVRGMSALLYPRMIGKVGLKGALRELAERLGGGNLEVNLNVSDGLDVLQGELSLCVLRIVQEAIVNAGRHARASHLWVTLAKAEGCVAGTIDDDGVGWPDEAGGMGLTLMQERTRKMNGSLAFETSPQGGARVRFSIPIVNETT